MNDPGTYESFCLMLAFLFLRPGEEREQFLVSTSLLLGGISWKIGTNE